MPGQQRRYSGKKKQGDAFRYSGEDKSPVKVSLKVVERGLQVQLSVNGSTKYGEQWIDPAEAKMRKSAMHGRDGKVAFLLGGLYLEGPGPPEGPPKNDEEGVRFIRIAAEKGHVKAARVLASMYEREDGLVPRDLVQARMLYEYAAKMGDLRSQDCLGCMFMKGEGGPRDASAAEQLWRIAAERGFANAQYNLGEVHFRRRAYVSAAHCWSLAVEQQHGDACWRLGQLYEEGNGVDKDPGKALQLWGQGAAHGSADCQCWLGTAYLTGFGGLEREYHTARSLLQQAADQGHARAVEKLRKCLQKLEA